MAHSTSPLMVRERGHKQNTKKWRKNIEIAGQKWPPIVVWFGNFVQFQSLSKFCVWFRTALGS